MAGNIWNAAENSPFKTNKKALCVPQPKQSMPNSCLFMQGIMYFSISTIVKFENTILQNLFRTKRSLF